MQKKSYVSQPTLNLEGMLNDASIDRIFAIDSNWNIIAWNKTSELVTGIRKLKILNRPLLEIFPKIEKDEEMMQCFKFALEGKTSFLPSKPGSFNRNFYENHFIPLVDEESHIVGVMNIMHDVAHRIKAEQQLQKLNTELKDKYNQLKTANAEFATFTSITGNELKDPIKKIYTSLEFIIKTEGKKLSDDSKAKFRRMQASLNRINLLLSDILSLSTVSSFSQEFTDVSLQKVLMYVLVLLQKKIEEKNAQIEVQPLPTINGSAQMLHYFFYNLLDNALKFQAPENTPHITVEVCRKLAKSNEDTGNQKEYHCISVVDNGIGFNPVDKERIFMMFERLHTNKEYHGSGIGLTICRKIAEAHGGYIEVESVQGQGSTFHCYFPVVAGV